MPKFIVAEDNANARRAYVLNIKLNLSGATVDEALTGEELVEKVRKGKYDVIFTDNEMVPGMDGIRAIENIRTFDKSTPIYMVSGSSMEKEALKAGASGYIDKGETSKIIEILRRMR
jgi:CheY-like chemotaxis protein